jgi:integrase
VLKRAKLKSHFSLHCLRHTYAAQRIVAGKNIYYVSRQLEHASTNLTLDTYGRWLRARSTAPANPPADHSGDQEATNPVTNDRRASGDRE